MKTHIFSRIVTFLFIVFCSFYSLSKNIYVNDASTVGDVWCTAISGSLGTIVSPYSTLKTALTNAVSGDIIYVDAGNYTEKYLSAKSGVTVIGAGAYKTTFKGSGISGIWFMKIDGVSNFSISNITASKYLNNDNTAGQIFTITNSSSNIKISNVLLAKNDGSNGDAGIYIGTGSSNIILDSISGSCQNTSNSGTAIVVDGKNISVFIKNSLFSGNDNSSQGSNGSAIRLKADVVSTPNVVLNIENSVFSENTAKKGGAIYIEGGSVTINKCKFLGNKTTETGGTEGGGAIWISKTNTLCTISNSVFKDNVAAADGGAIQVYTGVGPAEVKIENCLFENNSAVNGNDIHTRLKSGKKFNVKVNNCMFKSVGTNIVSGNATFAPCDDGILTITNSGSPGKNGLAATGDASCKSVINLDNLPSGYVDAAIAFPGYQGCPNAAICNPAIPGTTPTIICPTSSTGTVTLTATGPSNSKFTWYDVPTGGTAKGTSTSASPDFVASIPSLASGTKTFYVVSDLDNCQTRVPITLTCSTCTTPTPTWTSSATSACPNAKVKYATTAGKSPYVWTIPGTSGTDYTIVSGGTASSDSLIIKWLTKGDKVVKVGYTENSCVSPTPASITTKVSDLLTGAFTIQPSTNSCQNTPIKYAADKNYTNFIWQITGVLGTDYEIVAGGKTTDDTLIVKWKTLGPHTVKLDYTVGVGGCATTTSASNTTQVVANPSTLSFASSDVTQPTCKDTTGSVKINLPYAGKWNVKAIHSTNTALTKDTVETLSNTPFTLIFDSLYTGSYTFQIIDLNGCVSPVSSAITIDPQPISPAKPVLDINTIYCASDSYNTFSLDKIVFKPLPKSTETVKYLDENNNTLLGQTIVDSTKKYKFLFNNGVCTSKDTLVTKIPFDEGPLNVPAVLDISSTLICAVEKLDFNSLFSKIPATITSGFTLFISKDPSGNPIIPNTTYLPTNGGLLDSIYYTLANQNGCKNVKFGKLKFINNVGPTGLSLNLSGKQLFCGFSNPTVAKLDTVTAILNKTNPSNSLVWYLTETATTPLLGNTPLIDGFYYAAEKPTIGCESFVRKKIEAIIQDFNPTTLDANNIYMFCKGSSKKVLDLPITPNTSTNFVWLDSYKKEIMDQTIPLIPGIYYGAEKINGCISDKSKEIVVKFESPIISIAPTKLPTCGVGNGALKVVGGVTGYTYKWSKNGTPMTDIADQISNLPFDYTIKYSVIAQDTKGCKAYDTTQFSDCEPPGIPHVLTLNKDGKNDFFKLYYHTKYPNCKLSIFNRWGAMVYESKDTPYKDDWDGKPNVGGTLGSGELPTGTYFYLIDKGDGSSLESGYIELVK